MGSEANLFIPLQESTVILFVFHFFCSISRFESNYYSLKLKFTNTMKILYKVLASSDNVDCSLLPSLMITYSMPTEINELINDSQISVFPNLSTGISLLTWDSQYKNDFSNIKIQNYLGQNIFEKKQRFLRKTTLA